MRCNQVVREKKDVPPTIVHGIDDLQEIQRRGKLIALTDNSTTSYFIYKGIPMGYEFELLSLFAKHIGVELEIIVVKNMNEIIPKLQKGNGDLIAANLTDSKR